MRRRLLSLALALVMCLGLAVPVLAASEALPEIPPDVPSFRVSMKGGPLAPAPDTYQVRTAQAGALTDKETNTTIRHFIIRNSEPEDLSHKTYVLPLGSTITVSNLRNDWSNESGEVHIVGIQAYSDPDGDGVYDQWIYDFQKDPPLVPLSEEGISCSPEENGRYYTQAYVTKDNKMDFNMEVLPSSVFVTSDYLHEVFGPNTLILVQVEVWTVISPEPLVAFPAGTASTMAFLITGEKAEDAPDTPDTSAAPSFTDVPADAYYAAPVAWAVKNEITSGTGDNKFSPSQNCTNAQILTFIWRAYGKPEPTIDDPFTNSIPDGYKKAAVWAHEKGMVSGTSFDIDKPCTRAMAMTYLWQAAGSPETEPSGKFTDVAAGAPYAQAVAWAVANGITKGATDTTFAPENICQRGQIAVFLYNALADKA